MKFPESRTAPLRGGPVLRWGVAAPGGIARDFVAALHNNTDQRVHAVGSRSSERAEKFASEHGIPRSYGDYRSLVDDESVDIVYIASVNREHRTIAELAIAAGKHVLVEKPMGVNVADALAIATAARRAGVFAMEAMWSRYLPQTDVIKQLLDAEELGDVALVSADFGANFGRDDAAPVFREELGGGVLRDIGIYPVWFARFALGELKTVAVHGSRLASGLDAQAAMILEASGGAQAVLHTTMLADTPTVASICGTRARVEVRSPFLMPDGFEFIAGDEHHVWTEPSGLRLRDGLCWQATAVAQHIADGLTESPIHSLDDSLAIMQILDSVRTQF